MIELEGKRRLRLETEDTNSITTRLGIGRSWITMTRSDEGCIDYVIQVSKIGNGVRDGLRGIICGDDHYW